MPVVATSFSNDERTCSSTLLKTVSTTDILIDQVGKFQNSYFKKHRWKVGTVLQKSIFFKRSRLRAWYEIYSW